MLDKRIKSESICSYFMEYELRTCSYLTKKRQCKTEDEIIITLREHIL